jgi:hypothetical protein
VDAHKAATRFFARYLGFAYGHGSAKSVTPVTPALRVALTRDTASVTPVERRRAPRIRVVQLAPQESGVVSATGLVDDGGIATYALRITLREERGGWIVIAIDHG